MLMIDAHLDLSWNALSYDRDQTLTIAQIRDRESAMPGVSRGRNTVSLPELRRAEIGICLATLLARSRPSGKPVKAQDRLDLDYANQEIAHAMACGQLGYYRQMERRGQMRQIRTRADLDAVWSDCQKGIGDNFAIGYILSMEGSDPMTEPAQADFWWEQGLRTATLAHYGQSRYAFGTGGDGPVTPDGFELLKHFERLGMCLDLTHTAETAFFQCLDTFGGAVFASHNNLRDLVPGDRQFSKKQVEALGKRGAVIGSVLDAWMMYPGYKKGITPSSAVKLEALVDHMDLICQITGSADHCAIGSDLDGGFGTEQTPGDLDTITDLQKLQGMLKNRGYSDQDIAKIFHGNWLRFFRNALPQ